MHGLQRPARIDRVAHDLPRLRRGARAPARRRRLRRRGEDLPRGFQQRHRSGVLLRQLSVAVPDREPVLVRRNLYRPERRSAGRPDAGRCLRRHAGQRHRLGYRGTRSSGYRAPRDRISRGYRPVRPVLQHDNRGLRAVGRVRLPAEPAGADPHDRPDAGGAEPGRAVG